MAVLVVLLAAWVVVPAVTADSNDSFAARLAEHARDRGLGFAVTRLEQLQYTLDPPRDGGSVDAADTSSLAADAGSVAAATGGTSTGPGTTARGQPPRTGAQSPAQVTLHEPLAVVVGPALRGEGVFAPRVTVDGQPAIQTARLRPTQSTPATSRGWRG